MHRMLLAEFPGPTELAEAAYALREQGYRDIDAHTPYSTEDVRVGLGLRHSRLPLAIFVGGILGAGLAYGLQWLLVGYLYPLDVGGRPPHMPLAFVPITFEMGVLLASFTAFFGVLVLGRLVKLWDPVFEVEGFETSSVDRFWLRVDGTDPRFDPERTREELARFRPLRVELYERGRPQ
ncbi:MAG TPA: DUF3341 domain-containing protein [Polyangiaceae bacterium]|nr:DUF3341 domain-containing protein [Polyangiaceae bacterium]